MGEEFIAVIKLVSGEEILASVCVDESGDEPIIIAHTPVTMKMINNGMYVKIKPWMELADDDMFIFHMDKIITISEHSKEVYLGNFMCSIATYGCLGRSDTRYAIRQSYCLCR